jgi:uncharacterized membrane protein
MSAAGAIHAAFGIAALVCGLMVVAGRKGTATHRKWGYAYVLSMVGLIATSFVIYRLFRTFGPFHVASVYAAITLVAGLVPALRRKSPSWLARHYYWMTYSYAGLLAATASEIAVRLPRSPFWPAVVTATFLTIAAGALVIHTQAQRLLKEMNQFAGKPRHQSHPGVHPPAGSTKG